MKTHDSLKSVSVYFVLVLIVFMILGGCGGDDNSPTSSSSVASVEGTWRYIGTVTSNSCSLLEDSYESGTMMTQSLRIEQEGQTVTADITAPSDSEYDLEGTVDDSQVYMTVSDPTQASAGSCTLSMDSVEIINLTASDSGTGSITVTIDDLSNGRCSSLDIPCSVVTEGTWTRMSSSSNVAENVSGGSVAAKNGKHFTDAYKDLLKKFLEKQ